MPHDCQTKNLAPRNELGRITPQHICTAPAPSAVATRGPSQKPANPPPEARRSPPHSRSVEEERGRRQAIRRAGCWPIGGAIEEYRAAADRAVREAQKAHTIEYRWNTRHRFWERPDAWAASEPRAARIRARRELAIEIAEDREYLLRRLGRLAASPAAGSC